MYVPKLKGSLGIADVNISLLRSDHPKILIISYSWVPNDPRVLRQVSYLQEEGWDITVLGFGLLVKRGVTSIQIRGLSKKQDPQDSRFVFSRRVIRALAALFGLFRILAVQLHPASRLVKRLVATNQYTLILANEVETMPPIKKYAPEIPVLLDLHEFTPGHLEPGSLLFLIFQRYKEWLCRTYLKQANSLTTVSESISRAYERDFGVERPIVIRSLPKPIDIPKRRSTSTPIEAVYVGMISKSRGIVEMFEAIKTVPNIRLNLFSPGAGTRAAMEIAKEMEIDSRVIFHEPVETEQIAQRISVFDVSIIFIKPSSPNHVLIYPNKLFESIMARLALVVGPSCDVAELVNREGLGIVCEDFSGQALARALSQMTTSAVDSYRNRADAVARVLHWDLEKPQLGRALSKALSFRKFPES